MVCGPSSQRILPANRNHLKLSIKGKANVSRIFIQELCSAYQVGGCRIRAWHGYLYIKLKKVLSLEFFVNAKKQRVG